jgi:hypothetical protein
MVAENSEDGCSILEASPSYCAVHAASGSPTILASGRTSREYQHAGCATISMCRDENGSSDTNIDDVFWKITISKGIDPALFVCFTSFIDEYMERMMRTQCEKVK